MNAIYRAACAAIVLLTAAVAAATSPAAGDPELARRVRQAAQVTYVHGVTEELAREVIGDAGVPYLLELLADPDFPRRDNVVAFLTYLAGDDRTPALMDCLERPPGALAVPEEDRAMLLIPHALGRIARRGGTQALAALRAMTGEADGPNPLDRAVADGIYAAPMRDALAERALYGLADAGSASARRRLRSRGALASRTSTAGQPQPDRPEGGTPGGGAGTRLDDLAARGDRIELSYANHIDVPNRMTDVRLDQVLADATDRAARSTFDLDVACCIETVRGSESLTFGLPGDGLDAIDDDIELNAVLLNGISRVKVVRLINYCNGSATNIIGCAFVGGNGMSLVRLSVAEGILWIHEYGHNTGLSHNTDNRFMMFGGLNSSQSGLTPTECDRYHAPSPGTQASNQDIGECEDDDQDDVAGTYDNCPTIANTDQADADGDGLGDACDEICIDNDADGYGSPGSPMCAAGIESDCNDGVASVFPGSPDLCDGVDNDCDGEQDETLCAEFDVNGDRRMDGVELIWIGRAFGSCRTPADPPQWWEPVDYTRDGCVDGADIAVLGAVWGCFGIGPICP